jgi:hypothetical protein
MEDNMFVYLNSPMLGEYKIFLISSNFSYPPICYPLVLVIIIPKKNSIVM